MKSRSLFVALMVLLVGCARHPVTSPAATAPSPASSATAANRTAGGRSSALPTAVAKPPSPTEFHPAVALRDVHFDFDRYGLRAGDATLLEQNAVWLVSNSRTLVLIEGHADERGTNEYNIVLGDRRANATRDYLVAHGVRPERISLISYGEERPLCTDRTEACWGQNRRPHFLVKEE